MRQRQFFYAARPLLMLTVWLLRLIPRPVCRGLLAMLRHVPGVLGIGLRYVCVARLAKSCGECVAIHSGVYLHRLEQIQFGSHISIHPMCYIDGIGGLTIGDDVSIAHASSIMTSEHDYSFADMLTRDAPMNMAPVHIESNVWVGCGVRILAGVTIHQDSVVGAGAVVTRDVQRATIAVGVPAKELKGIEKRAA